MLEKPKVLIVDDNPKNVQVLATTLSNANYKISVARDGQEALTVAQKILPHLILLDVMMPVMDGYEACKKLKEIPETKPIPIIFLTANSEVQDVVKGLNLGASDYVTKPANSTELLARVQTHVRLRILEEEREREEERKRQLQKIESLNTMAGSIAHNFSNILMVVLGNLEMLSSEFAQASFERHTLEQAIEAARQAAELSTLMLLYVGQKAKKPAPLDMSQMIANLDESLEQVITKNIELKLDLDLDMRKVSADPEQLSILISNLVKNAAEAIGDSEKGTVQIVTKEMECDANYLSDIYIKEEQAEGDYAVIEVSDTGRGMDQETQAKMFDPFFTTQFVGRGLGLATVLGILRAHNGAVKVRSQLGKGTTVTILLPIAQEATPQASHDEDK